MNTVTLHFKADNQQLTALDGLYKLASNTVEYVKAIFTLGENWAGFDVVRAAWYTDFECISTVLDGNGECFVPWEVLSRPEGVTINLYGCDLEEESDGEAVLVDRLTTYPVKAILVDVDARVCGSETKPVTPSQFEQYIAIVQELVGTVRDITSCVLNPDYTLTINYSDDTSDTVGPIRGEQGEQGPTGPAGNGISKIEKISTAGLVDTYRITFTNGTHKDYTVTNGAKGDTGNGIESIYLTGTSGAVKTYTILFTNGNTFEYQVTDGEVTRAELEQALPTDSASGAIASFPDGTNLFPAKSLTVDIDPVQDLHGYDAPWVGGGGKNKANDNASAYSRVADYWTCPINLEQGKTYTIKVSAIGSTPTGFAVAYVKSGNRYDNFEGFSVCLTLAGDIFPKTFTVDASFTDPKIAIYIPNPQTTEHLAEFFSTVAHVQLEEGSTATTYEPYSNICPITGWTGCNLVVSPTEDAQDGTTYPVSWQTEAGTVYGGTVDVVSGVLMVKYGVFDLGTGTYTTTSNRASIMGFATDHNAKPPASDAVTGGYLAEKYKELKASGTLTSGTFAMLQSGQLIFFYDGVNTPTGQLVYPLATPTTYQLTPQQVATLLGQNNVWADCGNIDEVKYKADVQLYIDKLLNP